MCLGRLRRTTESSWEPSLDYGKDFYYNLLLSHLQSNGRDMESLTMYQEAIDAMTKERMIRKSDLNYDYATEYGKSRMYQTGCYLGAMLSRGAAAINHSLADHRSTENRHQELAQGITRTCYTAANRTKTGLIPNSIISNDRFEGSSFYLLK